MLISFPDLMAILATRGHPCYSSNHWMTEDCIWRYMGAINGGRQFTVPVAATGWLWWGSVDLWWHGKFSPVTGLSRFPEAGAILPTTFQAAPKSHAHFCVVEKYGRFGSQINGASRRVRPTPCCNRTTAILRVVPQDTKFPVFILRGFLFMKKMSPKIP